MTDHTGGRLRYRCALLRNGVKFTPWEFGHTVAHQAVHAGEQGFPVWLWGPVLIALGGSAWWVAAMWMNGRALYDRIAGARVARRRAEGAR